MREKLISILDEDDEPGCTLPIPNNETTLAILQSLRRPQGRG
jgi:hypothetical protein